MGKKIQKKTFSLINNLVLILSLIVVIKSQSCGNENPTEAGHCVSNFYDDYSCCFVRAESKYFDVKYCKTVSDKSDNNQVITNSDKSLKVSLSCKSNLNNNTPPSVIDDFFYPVENPIEFPVEFNPGLKLMIKLNNTDTEEENPDNNNSEEEEEEENNAEDEEDALFSKYTTASEVPNSDLVKYYYWKYYKTRAKYQIFNDLSKKFDDNIIYPYKIFPVNNRYPPPKKLNNEELTQTIYTSITPTPTPCGTSIDSCILPCCVYTKTNKLNGLIESTSCINLSYTTEEGLK